MVWCFVKSKTTNNYHRYNLSLDWKMFEPIPEKLFTDYIKLCDNNQNSANNLTYMFANYFTARGDYEDPLNLKEPTNLKMGLIWCLKKNNEVFKLGNNDYFTEKESLVNNFLEFFEHPVLDENQGNVITVVDNMKGYEKLDWANLPVFDKTWNTENNLLDELGFIQESITWKPYPFEDYINWIDIWNLIKIEGSN